MPVVERIAQDYAGDVEFIAVAWRSDLESTGAMAEELMPSGAIRWGLDEGQDIFSAYQIPSQPWTVLVADGVEITRWPGPRAEQQIRAELDSLVALSG